MNLEKIAKLAGVSHTAVSLALRGQPGVSDETRRRIVKLSRELDYEPHGPARALASGRTGLVGVIPGLDRRNPLSYWGTLAINGMMPVLREVRMGILLLPDASDAVIPGMITGRLVDATAFLMRPHENALERSRLQSIPSVTVNTSTSQEVDQVLPDDAGGVRQALAYLRSLGHRRIAYVSSDCDDPDDVHKPSRRERLGAYLETMRAWGVPAPPATREYMSLEQRMTMLWDDGMPTAYLCYSDHVAMRVLEWFTGRGIRVPEEASVVGIDNLDASKHLHPPLSTVRVPFEEMGYRAARMLLASIQDPDRPRERIILPETLVIRKSTAPPPGSGRAWACAAGTVGETHANWEGKKMND